MEIIEERKAYAHDEQIGMTNISTSDLFQGGNVEGIGDGPVTQLTPERQGTMGAYRPSL